MKDYFVLQYRILNRKLTDSSIHPFLAYILIAAGFIGLSELLFSKTSFAKYLIMLMGILSILKLSEASRNDFLRLLFGDQKKRQVRCIENGLYILPFLGILLIHQAWLEAIALSILALFLAVFQFQVKGNVSLPTPFSRRPFEFTVGFRNTFFLFPIIYALVLIAIGVNNFNLGLFALVLTFVIMMSFYSQPEEDYFIWVQTASAKKIIHHKLMIAFSYSSFLVIPVLLVLFVGFSNKWYIIMLVYLLGLLFLATIVLAKYAAFPNEMNLSEGLLIGVSVLFPPLLLFVIPFFYVRSLQKINLILNDKIE